MESPSPTMRTGPAGTVGEGETDGEGARVDEDVAAGGLGLSDGSDDGGVAEGLDAGAVGTSGDEARGDGDPGAGEAHAPTKRTAPMTAARTRPAA